MEYFKLNPNKIFEKEFKVTPYGYDPQEVDEILDLIIQDYQTFYHLIEELDHQNLSTIRTTENLKHKIRTLESTISVLENRQNQVTSYDNYSNLDLLKKISLLEEKIHQQEEEIKKKI